MKLAIATTTTALLGLRLLGQTISDPFMGDWQGSLTLKSGTAQNVAVYMIPLGESNYEARFVADFAKKSPYLYRLRGKISEGRFRFIDNIPFDVSRVVRSSEDGVVLDTSLWAGDLKNGSVEGKIAGKLQGGFSLKQSQRVSGELGLRPPAGAIVLFDGKSLDHWQTVDRKGRAPWKLVEGNAMEVKGGDIITVEKFTDHRLHLEFRLPYMPHDFGQARGNSGVYLQGRYEVQVLDSYGLEGYDNECGGIYQIAEPRVNACAPPLQWQSYDITFRAARFNAAGKKTANARITVVLNGVTIHENLELPKVTGGAVNDRESEPEGLKLQDHGNLVQFRNIWVEKL